MTTDSWVGGTGAQSFGTEGSSDSNWSTGKVPGSSDDAVISTSSTATIDATDEDVHSIALGSKDTLAVETPDFTVEDGTGPNVNAGTIDIEADGHLNFDGGTFDSTGSIEMAGGTGGYADISVEADTELDGTGTIAMQGVASVYNEISGVTESDGLYPALFSSEDISGSGLIGSDLSFINNGTVETGNGQLQIYGSAAGGEFVNNATVRVDNAGQLILGYPNTTTINNSGIIELDSTGSTTQLQIYQNVTIEPLNSGDQIIALAGSNPGLDLINSYNGTCSLTLVNETLKGAGTVGDSYLTLTNGSGSVINANNPTQDLFLNTGSNTITNAATATIEADGGNLGISSPVDNNGAITALNGGYLGIIYLAGYTGTTVTNNGTISAQNGSTVYLGTAFINNGMVNADNGGLLTFGDGTTRTFYNNNIIELDSTGSATKLEIAGNVTIDDTSSSSGIIDLAGDFNSDAITSDGSPATLALLNQTLEGGGPVEDPNLTLDVDSAAIVDADFPEDTLLISTGSNTITNAGLLETTNDGILALESTVNNTGTIDAVDGTVEVLSPNGITGPGAVDIGAGGDLLLAAPVAGNVNFAAAGGELSLNDNVPNGGIGGVISGAIAGDTIFLEHVNFSQGDNAVWDQTSGSGGTLSIYDQGTDLYTLDLAGSYNSLDFAVTNGEAEGTTLITVQNTPSYAENPGNNDEWILSDGNWAESAGPGSHPSGYNVALIGDWTGSGTDGIMWFNPTTGDTDEWQLSNTQWSPSSPGSLGTHPVNGTDGNSYQIVGTDDATEFFGNGIDDVLWTSVNSNGSIATDIWELNSGGTWMDSVSPGNHPAGYTVAATGDWTGDGTDGVLWYNASTGNVDEWQLSDGQWSPSSPGSLGSHPVNNTDGNSYQIAGVGDFFDNGIDDVLWTSTNSNGSIATDIWELNSSGTWMDSVSPGNHPAGYSVVAVGEFTGTGTSDSLWYNASTGDTDEWVINNGQWATSIDLGTLPGQIAGVGDFNGDGTKDILWHSPS